MKRPVLASLGLLIGAAAAADTVRDVDRLLCAAGQIRACIEDEECYAIPAAEVDVPDFVLIDLENRVLSTTRASQENRTTAIATVSRADGLIYLQGIDSGRAFSFVIDEATGRLTVAVSRDGLSVTVFGACTDANVEPAAAAAG